MIMDAAGAVSFYSFCFSQRILPAKLTFTSVCLSGNRLPSIDYYNANGTNDHRV